MSYVDEFGRHRPADDARDLLIPPRRRNDSDVNGESTLGSSR
jgi:hypothetical protein